jgi:hypothetical protein
VSLLRTFSHAMSPSITSVTPPAAPRLVPVKVIVSPGVSTVPSAGDTVNTAGVDCSEYTNLQWPRASWQADSMPLIRAEVACGCGMASRRKSEGMGLSTRSGLDNCRTLSDVVMRVPVHTTLSL